MSIWITSDWHFNHDREFIYSPRGFKSVTEMNEELVKRHNEVVHPDDEVYVLGDLMLGSDYEDGIKLIQQMNGNKHIILGNHDSRKRITAYTELMGIEPKFADIIQYRGYHFYLSHFPTITSNLEKESLKQCTICLYGHTHQQDNFYKDIPYIYHVGVDSHNCYPCNLDSIIEEMNNKVKECISYL